jgi:hypothetical protein
MNIVDITNTKPENAKVQLSQEYQSKRKETDLLSQDEENVIELPRPATRQGRPNF